MKEIKTAKCFDKFENEILVGDFVDIQTDPIYREVHLKEDGQLYFTPYDNEHEVCNYFKKDLIKITE